MKPRYKVTGCARFFLFLILFVPAVFFGAAYFRGENGVQIIKDFYHNLIGRDSGSGAGTHESGDTMSVKELEKKLDEAREEIRVLKRQLKEAENEIENLKSAKPPSK